MVVPSLHALAVSAESLVAQHVGPTAVPTLQKGLAELAAESLEPKPEARGDRGAGGPGYYPQQQHHHQQQHQHQHQHQQQQQQHQLQQQQQQQQQQLAGAALLAGGRFDPAALHRQILELELKAEYAGDAEERDDIELALVEQTEGVIASAIEAAVRDALEDSERLSLSAALESWEKEKRKISEQLSLKVFDWSDAAALDDDESMMMMQGLESTARRTAGQPQQQGSSVRRTPSMRALEASTLEFGEVVQRLNAYARLNEAQRFTVDDTANFFVASALAAVNGKHGFAPHEAACWGIVAATCREGLTVEALCAGSSSTTTTAQGGRGGGTASSFVVQERTHAAAEAARRVAARARDVGDPSARAWLARGGRRFIEDQHRDFVERELAANRDLLRAHVMGVDNFDAAGGAAKYVALLRYRNELAPESCAAGASSQNTMLAGPSVVQRVAPWAEVYVALRSCGARGAVAVTRSNPAMYGQAVVECVEALDAYDVELEVEGWLVDRSDRAHARTTAARRVAAAVAAVSAAYLTLKAANDDARRRRDPEDFVCPYRLAALNALCFNDAADPGVTATIEDYMWQQLWFATPRGGSASFFSDDGNNNGNNNNGGEDENLLLFEASAVALDTLRMNLVRWGSEHFDPDHATPFLYANQLLLAGDAARAVRHVADHGLAKEALHVSLSLDAYGLLRVQSPPNNKNNKEENKNKNSMATSSFSGAKRSLVFDNGGHASPAAAADGRTDAFDLGRALWTYARRLAVRGGNCALALEYLVWMRRRDDLLLPAHQPQSGSAGTPPPPPPPPGEHHHESLDDVALALPSLNPYVFVAAAEQPTLATCVINLIVETREFAALCGELNEDGSRRPALLDEHFTTRRTPQSRIVDASTTEAFIAAAAKTAAARGRARDAVELYCLAGACDEAMRVYADHLGRLAPVVVPAPAAHHLAPAEVRRGDEADALATQRREWIDSARAFAKRFTGRIVLQQRQQQQPAAAQGAGAAASFEGLRREFDKLLILADFFDAGEAAGPGTAVQLVDRLDIIPTQPRDVQQRLEAFGLLPSSIQRLFGDLALKYAEALYTLHEKARDDGNEPAARQYRHRASLLVNFAGLLLTKHHSVAVDVRTQLSRYEAMMM